MKFPHSIQKIAEIESCFPQKFGVPRQPRLVSAAQGWVIIEPDYNREEAFRELESFSHIWLLFVFHECVQEQWQPMIRPPRLGGNKKVGVFASRSTFRPNSLGMSVVKLNSFTQRRGRIALCVSELDLISGTPIIDIKPYLPYSDCINDASQGYAPDPRHEQLQVVLSSQAQTQLKSFKKNYPNFEALIIQVLSQDPRPSYKDAYDKSYGITLYDVNIKWRVQGNNVFVESLKRV
ncbi:MAG: tRNA (N6-threonylcarbamoyladenosine(37)-N6)-methyltransferase TrmO [Pseudomonadota bacterium]